MALSGKYRKVDTPRIEAKEPVFIRRVQDALAEPALEMYQLLADSHGCRLSPDLDDEIERSHDWSATTRLPD